MADEQERLLEEFSKGAEGTCSCPSTQYEKLDSIQVVPTRSGVDIELIPRTGQTLDVADIERCLRSTADKLRREEGSQA